MDRGSLAALVGCAIGVWFLIPQPRSSQATNATMGLSQPSAQPTPGNTEPEPTRTARANSLLSTTPAPSAEPSVMKAEPIREVVSSPTKIESSTPVTRAPQRPSQPEVIESVANPFTPHGAELSSRCSEKDGTTGPADRSTAALPTGGPLKPSGRPRP